MLRTLGEWHDIFVLSASELISSAGVPILPGVSVTFRGVALSTTILRQIGPHDLLSREVEGDEEVGGLLTTTPAGGYGQQSGVDLYKKLYTRRLTSDPNSYFHLTGYGLGLRPKELIRANDLLSLQRACEQQLRQEPGTVSVKVSLKLVGNGTLVLRYNALVQSIGPVSDEWTMPNR